MLAPILVAILGLASLSTAAPAPVAYAPDDVIVLKTDGTSEVMKAADFDKLERRAAETQFNATAFADSIALESRNNRKISRRGCEESSEVQVLSVQDFLNWDVAISPVISSLTSNDARVAVTKGYSLANSLTVSSSSQVTLIKDVFSTTLSISYAQTWTTDQSQTLTFAVPANQFGVIVSQPYVHRIQGNVLSGCTDSWNKDSFMSDSYTSQSYGDLDWVKGVIRLCSSESYPIPYCIGEGTHA